MRDFNFFSHITEERKSDSKRKYIGFGIIGVLAFIFVVNFSVNLIKEHVLDKNINYYQGEIDNKDMQEKLDVAMKVEKEHEDLEKYYNNVKVATEQVYDLVFTQISIDNKTLTIQALSKTRSAISDLQYNLNNLGFIENTYISGIGERNAQGDYSFSISCTLKEVGNNENQ